MAVKGKNTAGEKKRACVGFLCLTREPRAGGYAQSELQDDWAKAWYVVGRRINALGR